MKGTNSAIPDMSTTFRCELRVDGAQEWQNIHGKRHRIGGPAVVYPNGSAEWWVDGELHREDGPALAYKCGYIRWHKHGRIHCLSGPAIVHECGCWHSSGKCMKGFYLYDHLHMKQGYYVNDRRLTEEEFNLYVDQLNSEVLIPPGKFLKFAPTVDPYL